MAKKKFHLEPKEGVEIKQKFSLSTIKVRNIGESPCDLEVEYAT